MEPRRLLLAIVPVVGFVVLMGVPPATRLVVISDAAEPGDPCMGDIEKLCPEARRGHGGILTCLLDHQSELSRACRAVVTGDAPAGEPGDARPADPQSAPKGPPPLLGVRALIECRSDLTAFCRSAGQKRERLRKCLRRHRADLSAACTRALDEEQQRRKEFEEGAARKRSAPRAPVEPSPAAAVTAP